MYKLHYTKKAQGELKKLSYIYQDALLSVLETIQDDPYLAGKSLNRELTGKFSFKIGIYRIIYKIKEDDQIVVIYSAGHRSTVYN